MSLRKVFLRVVMGVLAGVALLLLRTVFRGRLGPEDDWWERIRSEGVPILHDYLDAVGLYATYSLDPDEYAGVWHLLPEEAEVRLEAAGFVRNPVAALKIHDDGTKEVGSWVYRESWLARRQLHVMLFEGTADGEPVTDVYAHVECSSIHPLYAYHHYYGIDFDPESGVAHVRDLFDVDHRAVSEAVPRLDGSEAEGASVDDEEGSSSVGIRND